MEPAQPADRVPADSTPPDGQPPADVPAGHGGEPAATDPTPPRPAASGKSERSPKDMAISLLVLLVPIALLLAFYRGFLGGDQATTVDPAPAIEQARSANVFPVTQPQGLGSDWTTVSARYQTVEGGANLRLGYLTPEGRGVQLLQSSVPADRLLPAELTSQSQPQGPTELAGRTWQLYTARGNQQALVLLEPTRTVIVVGDARDNELRELAGSLR
ncbi:DUF4245 domain-containing protein [Micromonospora sp. NIE79]|uniref:DUF4245 domain-containing protein n=1 Tax=Micromonospora trifolii TaxID=2911208 RepID=A0ABS9N571_9ACTN|nr:DUF4245 domain-containing protein [Micromonospora trifolii]MCG5444651.1 DUF4245 domain-containing protein [Micromonospora trifolii]